MIQQKNILSNFNLVGVFATTAAFLAKLKLAATKGMTFYDTTNNSIYAYNGSAWVACGNDKAMTPPTVVASGLIRTAPTTVTATADGTGTGVIAAGVGMVAAVSDGATKVITLPAPVPGQEITILPTAAGFELQSSAPGTVAINGNTPTAGHKASVAAAVVVKLLCVSATKWIANTYAADGTEAKLEAAH